MRRMEPSAPRLAPILGSKPSPDTDPGIAQLAAALRAEIPELEGMGDLDVVETVLRIVPDLGSTLAPGVQERLQNRQFGQRAGDFAPKYDPDVQALLGLLSPPEQPKYPGPYPNEVGTPLELTEQAWKQQFDPRMQGLATAARVVPTLGGAAVGAWGGGLAGGPVGAIAGARAGGAGGALVGEGLAQTLEMYGGGRENYSPAQFVLQPALATLLGPTPRATSGFVQGAKELAKHAGAGAVYGGAGTLATDVTERWSQDQPMPTLPAAAKTFGIGAAFGGGLGTAIRGGQMAYAAGRAGRQARVAPGAASTLDPDEFMRQASATPPPRSDFNTPDGTWTDPGTGVRFKRAGPGAEWVVAPIGEQPNWVAAQAARPAPDAGPTPVERPPVTAAMPRPDDPVIAAYYDTLAGAAGDAPSIQQTLNQLRTAAANAAPDQREILVARMSALQDSLDDISLGGTGNGRAIWDEAQRALAANPEARERWAPLLARLGAVHGPDGPPRAPAVEGTVTDTGGPPPAPGTAIVRGSPQGPEQWRNLSRDSKLEFQGKRILAYREGPPVEGWASGDPEWREFQLDDGTTVRVFAGERRYRVTKPDGTVEEKVQPESGPAPAGQQARRRGPGRRGARPYAVLGPIAAAGIPEDPESEWDNYARAALMAAGAVGMAAGTHGGMSMGIDEEGMLAILGNQQYKQPLQEVFVRELLQNSIDAVRSSRGSISVQLAHGKGIPLIRGRNADGTPITASVPDNYPNSNEPVLAVEVADTGPGLTKQELQTVYSDLFGSGKVNDKFAVGGKGMAKGSYLGSSYGFEGVSIAKEADGKVWQHTFTGSPKMLIGKREIVIDSVPAEPGAQTGLKFRVILPEDRAQESNFSFYHADDFLENLIDFSPELPALTVRSPRYQQGLGGSTPGTITRSPRAVNIDYTKPADVEDLPQAELRLYVQPPRSGEGETGISLAVANNGMFAYRTYIDGLPEAPYPQVVTVDVRPKVTERDNSYPFTNSREDVQFPVRQAMEKLLKRWGTSIATQKQQSQKQAWTADVKPFRWGGKEYHIASLDGRMTPADMQYLTGNPVAIKLFGTVSGFIDDILKLARTDRPTDMEFVSQISKVGITLDPDNRGVWFPDPNAPPKPAGTPLYPQAGVFFVNPLAILASGDFDDPIYAAGKILDTTIHELAHQVEAMPYTTNRGRQQGHHEDWWRKMGYLYSRIAPFSSQLIKRLYTALSPGQPIENFNPLNPNRLPGRPPVDPNLHDLLQWYQAYSRRPAGSASALRPTAVPERPAGGPGLAGDGNVRPPGGGVEAGPATAGEPAPRGGPGLGSESGFVRPGILSAAIGPVAGAVLGAGIDRDDRLRGALVGAGLGAGLSAAVVGGSALAASRRGGRDFDQFVTSLTQPERDRLADNTPAALHYSKFAQLVRNVRDTKEQASTTFIPYHRMQKAAADPRFRAIAPLFRRATERLKQYENSVRGLRQRVGDDLDSVLNKLRSAGDFIEFQNIVNLRRDAHLGLRSGVPQTESGLTPQATDLLWRQRLLEAQQQNPVVWDAIQAHDAVMHRVGQEFVNRGWLDPAVLRDNPDYITHYVLDYLTEHHSYWGGLNARKSAPRFMTAFGGQRATLHDYFLTTSRYLLDAYADLERFDAVMDVVKEFDISSQLTPNILPITAQGRMSPPARTIPAGYEVFTFWGRDKSQQYAAVIPTPVADQLKDLYKQPRGIIPLINTLHDYWRGSILTAVWGNYITTNALGDLTRFLNHNTDFSPVGHVKALANAARILVNENRMAKGTITPQTATADQLLMTRWADLMGQVDLGTGAATAEVGSQLGQVPHIRILTEKTLKPPPATTGERARQYISETTKPWSEAAHRVYSTGGMIRETLEGWPRMAKFLYLTDKIAKEQGVPGTMLTRGLTGTPKDIMDRAKIAGEITRFVMVDYGNLTPQERVFLRGVVAPFYTFHKHNTVSYIPGLAKGPEVKFLPPGPGASMPTPDVEMTRTQGFQDMAAALTKGAIGSLVLFTAWNEHVLPKLIAEFTGRESDERKVKSLHAALPDWQRWQPHLLLPWWENADGQMQFLYLGLQTPIQAAAGFVGQAGALTRLKEGFASPESFSEKGEDYVTDSFKQARRNVVGVTTPLYQTGHSLIFGESPRTGENLVPKNATPGDWLGAAGQAVIGSLPYANVAARTAEEAEGPEVLKRWFKNIMLGGSRGVVGERDITQANARKMFARAMQEQAEDRDRTLRKFAQLMAPRFVGLQPEHVRMISQAATNADPLLRSAWRKVLDELAATDKMRFGSIRDEYAVSLMTDRIGDKTLPKLVEEWLKLESRTAGTQ